MLIFSFNLVFGSLISILLFLIIIKNVFKIKYEKNNKFINNFIILIFSLLLAIINYYNNSSMKIFLTLPIVIIIVKLLTNKNISEVIAMSVISVLYLFASEVLVAIFISLLKIEINNRIFGGSLGSLLVVLFSFILLKFKKIKEICKNIVYWFNAKKNIHIIILVSMFIFLILNNIFNYLKSFDLILVNTIIVTIFSTLIIMLFSEKKEKNEISENYNQLLEYLDVYEKELIEKRKIIHDFNNKLIIINSYVSNNKELKIYLKSIMNEQKLIATNSLIKYIDLIPNGLKGIIYYKISPIYNKLKIEFIINDEIKDYKLEDDLFVDYLKIVGILLDNAIESSLESTDKVLIIELSDDFTLSIKNSYDNNCELTKIFESGYSTKGKKRGYGLSIVSDIMKINKKIKVTINTEDLFIATLSIKQ